MGLDGGFDVAAFLKVVGVGYKFRGGITLIPILGVIVDLIDGLHGGQGRQSAEGIGLDALFRAVHGDADGWA